MKRLIQFTIAILLGINLFVSCAVNKTALGIADYINHEILNIAELENKALERYASVTGENYTTDHKIYEELNGYVIPVYKRFLDSLRNINPDNKEIRALHSIYIHGSESIYNGFKIKISGIRSNNIPIIKQGNKKIEKGRIETERWRDQLMSLYDEYGIKQ